MGSNATELFTHPFADWTSFVCRVGSILLGDVAAGLHGAVVDGLEDLLVELLCGVTVERHPHQQERVGKTLNANTDGPVEKEGRKEGMNDEQT